jgi:hypothetical protein
LASVDFTATGVAEHRHLFHLPRLERSVALGSTNVVPLCRMQVAPLSRIPPSLSRSAAVRHG